MANALSSLLLSKPTYRDEKKLSFDDWLDINRDRYNMYTYDDIESMFRDEYDGEITILGITKPEWQWLYDSDTVAYSEAVSEYQDNYYQYCIHYMRMDFYSDENIEQDYEDYLG